MSALFSSAATSHVGDVTENLIFFVEQLYGGKINITAYHLNYNSVVLVYSQI